MRSHSKLPLAGLTLLVSLVLVSCGGDGEASKDLQTLKGDGFTVSMPGKPERSEKSAKTPVGTVKTVSYTSDGKDKAFSIGYTDLPKGIEGDLHRAIAGGAAEVHGTVKDEKATTYQGFKARDARITGAADDKGTLFLRAILAKGRLYVLQSIGEGNNLTEAPDAYDEIVNSLKID